MINRLRFVAPLAATLVIVASAAASAYTAKGIVRCPEMVEEDANTDFRQMNKFWLLGYLTARNYAEDADVGERIDDEAIYILALAYCRENPGKDIDDAAIEVYERLR